MKILNMKLKIKDLSRNVSLPTPDPPELSPHRFLLLPPALDSELCPNAAARAASATSLTLKASGAGSGAMDADALVPASLAAISLARAVASSADMISWWLILCLLGPYLVYLP